MCTREECLPARMGTPSCVTPWVTVSSQHKCWIYLVLVQAAGFFPRWFQRWVRSWCRCSSSGWRQFSTKWCHVTGGETTDAGFRQPETTKETKSLVQIQGCKWYKLIVARYWDGVRYSKFGFRATSGCIVENAPTNLNGRILIIVGDFNLDNNQKHSIL